MKMATIEEIIGVRFRLRSNFSANKCGSYHVKAKSAGE